MICLDTNYLIRALIPSTVEAEEVKGWLKAGIPLSASAIVWYEFTCGPVQARERDIIHSILTGGILTFGEIEAGESARLFNAAGRVRRLRVDTMIAATAVAAQAELATSNTADFSVFKPFGLMLKDYQQRESS